MTPSNQIKVTSFILLISQSLIGESLISESESNPTDYKYRTIPEEDFIHDRNFFLSNETFQKSLKYGSPFLPRHLYDFNRFFNPNTATTKSDLWIETGSDQLKKNGEKSGHSTNREITSLNQVLPPGFQNPLLTPLADPQAFAALLVQVSDCATQNGYTDPDLGTFNLDPKVYCVPATLRFIPKVTCCAPEKPIQINLRLLLFPAARGRPGQPHENYGLAGQGRSNSGHAQYFMDQGQTDPGRERSDTSQEAFYTVQEPSDTSRGRSTIGLPNFGPSTIPVTELNWRSKVRPPLIPPTGKIVYLVHGFGDNVTDSQWVRPVARAWNARGATVIAVDWGFSRSNPFQSAADMRTVGAVIGYSVVTWKIAHRTLLVGHSMGAQAVAEAANFAKRKGVLIPECTGLDPAGPSFDGGPPIIRLTKDDCGLVTVIHSGAELTQYSTGTLPLRLGSLYKSGHCDYWVNCGHFQGIKCTDPKFGDYFKRESVAIIQQKTDCAHYRATLVYLAQLRGECKFRSVFCSNCGTETNQVNLNFDSCDIDPSKGYSKLPPFHGCTNRMNANFFLATSDRYPFC